MPMAMLRPAANAPIPDGRATNTLPRLRTPYCSRQEPGKGRPARHRWPSAGAGTAAMDVLEAVPAAGTPPSQPLLSDAAAGPWVVRRRSRLWPPAPDHICAVVMSARDIAGVVRAPDYGAVLLGCDNCLC